MGKIVLDFNKIHFYTSFKMNTTILMVLWHLTLLKIYLKLFRIFICWFSNFYAKIGKHVNK